MAGEGTEMVGKGRGRKLRCRDRGLRGHFEGKPVLLGQTVRQYLSGRRESEAGRWKRAMAGGHEESPLIAVWPQRQEGAGKI
jgi:hypothetical protein